VILWKWYYLKGVQEMDILDLGNFLFSDGDSDIWSYCLWGISYHDEDSEDEVIKKLSYSLIPGPFLPQCDNYF
jgi:hypothetical protein